MYRICIYINERWIKNSHYTLYNNIISQTDQQDITKNPLFNPFIEAAFDTQRY